MLYKLIFLICCSFSFNCFSAQSLDEIGLKYQTDKSSLSHNYLIHYEFFLERFRNKQISLLEIGFLVGASARTWEEYFPNAKLYFIDVNKWTFEKYGQDLSSRSHYFIGDQSNIPFLKEVVRNTGSLDIILDDGGHTMEQQLVSFNTLFPYLNSGGIYIIEDLHTSFIDSFSGNHLEGGNTTVAFLQKLVQDLNHLYAIQRVKRYNQTSGDNKYISKHTKLAKSLVEQIEALYFFRGMCLILKK